MTLRLEDPIVGPTDDVLTDIQEEGFSDLGQFVDPDWCKWVLLVLRGKHDFGPDMFLSEQEFDANPVYTGVNPRPGRNITEWLDTRPAVEERLSSILSHVLGNDWSVLNKKLVCGVPSGWVPEWLHKRIDGNPVNNLGAYVRPQYRDTTYFMGIDWHQDIIDWPGRVADFVTLYVYLHDVGEKDAPLHVQIASHYRGAQSFPHQVTGSGVTLRGPAGSTYMWHPFTLHGTQPTAGDEPRFSLRYLIQGNGDRMNASVAGPLSLAYTRADLASNGSSAIKGNAIASCP